MFWTILFAQNFQAEMLGAQTNLCLESLGYIFPFLFVSVCRKKTRAPNLNIQYRYVIMYHPSKMTCVLTPGPVGWDWGGYRANLPMSHTWVPTPCVLTLGPILNSVDVTKISIEYIQICFVPCVLHLSDFVLYFSFMNRQIT